MESVVTEIIYIITALPINGKNAEPYGMDLPIKKQKQDNESKVQ